MRVLLGLISGDDKYHGDSDANRAEPEVSRPQQQKGEKRGQGRDEGQSLEREAERRQLRERESRASSFLGGRGQLGNKNQVDAGRRFDVVSCPARSRNIEIATISSSSSASPSSRAATIALIKSSRGSRRRAAASGRK